MLDVPLRDPDAKVSECSPMKRGLKARLRSLLRHNLLVSECSPMKRGLKVAAGDNHIRRGVGRFRVFPDEEGTESHKTVNLDTGSPSFRVFPDEEGTESITRDGSACPRNVFQSVPRCRGD